MVPRSSADVVWEWRSPHATAQRVSADHLLNEERFNIGDSYIMIIPVTDGRKCP
jgi:hypothetical protein